MKSSTLNRCQSCKAMIVWVTTKNGKSMPVDYTAGLENRSMFPISPPLEFDAKTMTSHFATCPDAKKFRKR